MATPKKSSVEEAPVQHDEPTLPEFLVGIRRTPGQYGSYEAVVVRKGEMRIVSVGPEPLPWAVARAAGELDRYAESTQGQPASQWPQRPEA